MCIYIYIYTHILSYICVYMYIYIYREREGDRDTGHPLRLRPEASPQDDRVSTEVTFCWSVQTSPRLIPSALDCGQTSCRGPGCAQCVACPVPNGYDAELYSHPELPWSGRERRDRSRERQTQSPRLLSLTPLAEMCSKMMRMCMCARPFFVLTSCPLMGSTRSGSYFKGVNSFRIQATP